MVLTAAVVLVALALSILALGGVFGEFPSSWGWFLAVISGLGLAMGTQTVFQTLWGQPRVQTEFERVAQGAERHLVVFIKNMPMKHKLLRMLGVKREGVQSLTVQFQVKEVGSGKTIVAGRLARIWSDDDTSDRGRDRIALPPTYSVAASVAIVWWDSKNNNAFILPNRIHDAHVLNAGHYLAEIILLVDGAPSRISRSFVVGKTADDLMWASS